MNLPNPNPLEATKPLTPLNNTTFYQDKDTQLSLAWETETKVPLQTLPENYHIQISEEISTTKKYPLGIKNRRVTRGPVTRPPISITFTFKCNTLEYVTEYRVPPGSTLVLSLMIKEAVKVFLRKPQTKPSIKNLLLESSLKELTRMLIQGVAYSNGLNLLNSRLTAEDNQDLFLLACIDHTLSPL